MTHFLQSPTPSWTEERNQAVQMARSGQTLDALVVLGRLYREHPDDVGIVNDYIAVSSWAGRDEVVTSVYEKLPPASHPDYALEAVGHSYRNLHQPAKAFAIYQYGADQSPKNSAFIAGEILSIVDLGNADQALHLANDTMQRQGEKLDLLLAASTAALAANRPSDALHYADRALQQDPTNLEAKHNKALALERISTPQQAMQFVAQNPRVLSDAELRRIEGDEAAALVRDEMIDSPNESKRFERTDHAIAVLDGLITKWMTQGFAASSDVLRARFDRMVALRDHRRMNDVVNEYGDLTLHNITIPPYAMEAAADAHLYLHEPEQARDIYLNILQTDPKNFDAQLGLFYAYTECDDYDNAYQVIDKLVQEQPLLAQQRGAYSYLYKPHAPNPDRATAERVAGAARLYSGQIAEGAKRIMPVVRKDPNSPASREALGNLYMAHGWPRMALTQYKTGLMLKQGSDIGNEVGVASTNLALQNFRQADAETKNLVKRQPENSAVERLDREWQVHDMAELRVRAGYDFLPMTSHHVTGGEAYGIDTTLFSSPVDYNWRLFAGEYYTHQKEPNAEGRIGLSRSTMGVEYRDGPLTASAGPTYNLYHGTERLGGAGEATWSINDYWTIASSGELFSRAVPLRALNSGVTAHFANINATWRENESRQVRFGTYAMPFSDKNFRAGLDAGYTQRLYVIPDFKVDGLLDGGYSQNSADENRFYFNPHHDLIALAGARATHTLYQHYSTLYEHSLTLLPGGYWQQNYGNSFAFKVRYEQRLFLANTFEAGLGVNFMRHAYDGVPENDVGLSLDLTDRF